MQTATNIEKKTAENPHARVSTLGRLVRNIQKNTLYYTLGD